MNQQITGLVVIANAAHSLALLGTAGLNGKFLMPRSGGDSGETTTKDKNNQGVLRKR